MLVQENLLNDNFELTKHKRKHYKHPSFKKSDKIKQTLLEWNTIEDVELYKDLYLLYTKIFLATHWRCLECLNYYTDYERDNDNGKEYIVQYAEIKNTWQLPMRQRYDLHKKLLDRVMSNDTTLIYCNNKIINSDETNKKQLSLFT